MPRILFEDLPIKRYLNLAAIKRMVTAAEAAAKKLQVQVTICIVDESGNLLFVQKADTAALNTVQFAQKRARHASLYNSASKDGADALKKGNVDVLAYPDFFPNQGGLTSQVEGRRSVESLPVAQNRKSTKLWLQRASVLSLKSSCGVGSPTIYVEIGRDSNSRNSLT